MVPMKYFYDLRRIFLKTFVPEFIWPKYVVIDETNIPIKGMPYSFGIKRILSKGNYEVNERALLNNIISEGDQIIELGGSIGILAAIMSKAVSKKGLIISVEASQKLANVSKQWLEPKGNVKILCGIGFPVNTVPVKYTKFTYVNDGNSLAGMVDFSSEQPFGENQIEIFDLKTICTQFNIVPNILVVDIEGSEIVFQEDNIEFPGSIKHIVIEMHPRIYGETKEISLIKGLEKYGFYIEKEIDHVYHLKRN